MKKLLIFLAGAAVGSLVTWKLVEEKYKKIADEEIESVKEEFNKNFKRKEDTAKDEVSNPEMDEEIQNVKEYKGMLRNLEYLSEDEKQLVDDLLKNPEQFHVTKGKDGSIYVDQGPEYVVPEVINPDMFGDDGYETDELTYYSDGILANRLGEIIDEPEGLVGDALEHFGDYEEDAVHVRNEQIKIDYEILKNDLTYSEVYGEE